MYGSDIPEPFENFQQLREEYNVHQQIVTNLHEAGFKKPTPIQMQAVPVMLQVSCALFLPTQDFRCTCVLFTV